MPRALALLALTALTACGASAATDAPPDGWANNAPTRVERVVDRGDTQLLDVSQGALRTWVAVPQVHADAGDYVLLGRGTARTDVPIPELGERAPELVDIAHVRVVDAETARRTVAHPPPEGALPIADAYAELDARAGTKVRVYGRVVKAPNAVGAYWVHLRDGTGGPGTDDLTVQTQEAVVPGQWVAFEGTLRKDVDLGFGYHYDALVEGGTRVE